MSALPRLVRAVHTSAVRLEAAAATAAATAAPAVADKVGTVTGPTGLPIDFTAKGRPIYTRPARTTRVTLPSGYPEPSTYPPPPKYFEEVEKIDASLPATAKGPKRHPLWAFFSVPPQSAERLKEGDLMPDMGSVVRIDEEDAAMSSGRAWATDELRVKSFEDLHILWYVLIRERNVIATQQAERKRIGIQEVYGGALIKERQKRCATSMARIKAVLNERRLAIAATAAPVAAHRAANAGTLPLIPLALPTSALSESALDALAEQGKVARTASGATILIDAESTAAFAPSVDVEHVLAKLAGVRKSSKARRNQANRLAEEAARSAKDERRTAHAERMARLEKERPAKVAAKAERKAAWEAKQAAEAQETEAAPAEKA